MTKHGSFKKVVRRHAEETGQRYTEALTDLEGLEGGCSTSPSPSACSPISESLRHRRGWRDEG